MNENQLRPQNHEDSPSANTRAELAPVAEKKESWASIQRELKDALDTWSELTTTSVSQPDPEQEKVAKVKRLLAELQIKMREF